MKILSTEASATFPSGNRVNERKGRSVARKRYQKGSLKLLGPKGSQWWQGRWREYLADGSSIDHKDFIGFFEKFETKRSAQREFDDKFLNKINASSYQPRTCCTFSEFVDKWKKEVLSQFKPSSQRSMTSEVMGHLVPYFGETALNDINNEQVQRFVASRKLSAKYTKNLIADFKTIWKTARAWGYVSHDPAFGIRLPKVQRKQAPTFTLEEVKQIMFAAKEPFRTMYWIAGSLGHRSGEVVGLHVRNLDFENLQIEIVESVWEGKLQSPKTGNGVRRFSMSQRLADHLKKFVAFKNPDDLLFSKNGKPYRQDGVQKYNLKPLLKRLKIKQGVKRVGLHAFRHANVTFMDQLNAPVAVRMARIGHGDFETTKGYTHLDSADDRRIAEGIDSMLASERIM